MRSRPTPLANGQPPSHRHAHRRPRGRARERSRAGVMAARVVALVASCAVVASSGVAWATLRDLSQGITTSNALAGTRDAAQSRDGSVNILLIGLDSRKDQNGDQLPAAILDQLHAGDGNEGGYNTNTLILMHIPNDGSRVTAFSIPRDDYVAVNDIPNNDHVKIKEAYGLKKASTEDALAKTGVTDRHVLETAGREAGRRETVQTVEGFLGVSIDHFAEVNLAGFYDLSTALDGVQVCLNSAVKDSYSGADFPAGLQTLNGAQALAFVRQRHGLTNGDLDRTHRQQAFLASVTHKLSSAGTFTDVGKLQSLFDVARRDVVISADWDIPTFIKQATNLTGGNVQFATLPIERFDTVDGQSVNIVDNVKVQKEVRVAFGLESAAAPATTTAAEAPAYSATVDVLNGGSRAGTATTVSEALSGAGFTQGTTGNSTSSSSATSVSYGSGAEADADAVATLLGRSSASPDSSLPAGRVSVVLGKSYIPATDLAKRAAALKPTTAAATSSDAAPAAPAAGPQGLPVDGSGIPCVN
ncbi:MAG: LCP family protein [Mycobacteriaceae bacterium]